MESLDKWTSRTPNVTISASETSVLIGGLRPVTNYQIRAFAINGLGKSESSEVIILKTIEETPGGPPLHIKAVPLSSKSIKVRKNDTRFSFSSLALTFILISFLSSLMIGIRSLISLFMSWIL